MILLALLAFGVAQIDGPVKTGDRIGIATMLANSPFVTNFALSNVTVRLCMVISSCAPMKRVTSV